MKKLMIVAAAAFGMAAFGDIESSNIVGYANAPTTVDQYNFIAVGFNTVGCNTFDIQQISLDDNGAGTLGWGTENFSIWAGGPDVVEGSGFFYLDPSMDPACEATSCYWGDEECNKVAYSVAAGQSVVIQCGPDINISFAGQVPSEDVELTTVDQYNFVANPYPVELDIQSIKIDDGGAGTIGWGTENFSVWAGGPDVVAGSGFFFLDPSMDPEQTATECYWGDEECNKVTYPIAIGQGTVIQCSAGLTISIKAPYVIK